MKSLLDPNFKYTPSFDTDLRKKFEDMRKERERRLKAELKRAEEIAAEAEQKAKAIAEEAEQVLAKTRIKGKIA